jgi:glycosyltransferase involved in cell wall biosynthesis
VPTRNRKENLARAVAGLMEQTYPAERYEVVVVNDGSTDGTADLLREVRGKFGARIVALNGRGAGPAAARNSGLAAARGEIIGFTDDDVKPARDWIEKAVNVIGTSGAAGVEGRTVDEPFGRSYYRSKTENLAGGKFATCNIFYRKAVLDAVGGFDETFVLPCREDSDLAFRILDAGHRILFSPEVSVIHGNCNRSILFQLRYPRYLRHSAYLAWKHPRRYRFSDQFLPSYAGMVLLSLIVIAGVFFLPLVLPLAAAALYLFLLGRFIKRNVYLGNVDGIGNKALMILASAALPWVHTVHLLGCALSLWRGKRPLRGSARGDGPAEATR